MTTYDMNIEYPGAGYGHRPFGRRIADLLERTVATWRRRGAIRQTECQLGELSDHMLADIGLTRSENPAVAAGRRTRDGSIPYWSR